MLRHDEHGLSAPGVAGHVITVHEVGRPSALCGQLAFLSQPVGSAAAHSEQLGHGVEAKQIRIWRGGGGGFGGAGGGILTNSRWPTFLASRAPRLLLRYTAASVMPSRSATARAGSHSSSATAGKSASYPALRLDLAMLYRLLVRRHSSATQQTLVADLATVPNGARRPTLSRCSCAA